MFKESLGATSNEVALEEDFSRNIVGRFKDEGEFHHRCLSGPKRRESVVYPTWRRSIETDGLVPSYNSIVLPSDRTGERTIFDSFSAIDKNLQLKKGKDRRDIRTPFARNKKFLYIVLSRDIEVEGSTAWIGPWEYPTSVSKKITELQEELSTRKKENLMYGPYWSWDAVIKRYIDEEMYKKTKSRPRSIRYSVNVNPECNPLAGKVPAGILESRDFYASNIDMIDEFYRIAFTPEELDVIESYEGSLNEYVKPIDSAEALLEILHNFPINLDAMDKEGDPVFKHKEELKEELSKFGDRIFPEYKEPPQLEESIDKKKDEKVDTKAKEVSSEW